MDGRHADEYHGARVAPVAQLDRVLPSEGRGRGFESRLVRHLSLIDRFLRKRFFNPLQILRNPKAKSAALEVADECCLKNSFLPSFLAHALLIAARRAQHAVRMSRNV